MLASEQQKLDISIRIVFGKHIRTLAMLGKQLIVDINKTTDSFQRWRNLVLFLSFSTCLSLNSFVITHFFMKKRQMTSFCTQTFRNNLFIFSLHCRLKGQCVIYGVAMRKSPVSYD